MVARKRSIARFVFGWTPEEYVITQETAWLNGVRGVAAFLVMINHYSMEWLSPFSDAPFGSVVLEDRNPDGVWYYRAGDRFLAPWRLPILRIFMVSGGAQVAVFFVLSGMVLSWSPIGSVNSHNYERLYQSLGSSVIRRWFRLFLPCFIATFTYCLHKMVVDYKDIYGALNQVWDYVIVTWKWSNPFETSHITQFSTNHGYSFVMWTIPFEFGGSMFIYVSLLGLGRIQNYRRRACAMIFVALYAILWNHWDFWLFGSGLVLADYVRHSGGFAKLSSSTTAASRSLWAFGLAMGLVFMGWVGPMEWYTQAGWEWTALVPLPEGWRSWVGEERFWWGIGGVLTIASCCHLGTARKFFELPFIQHLGKISFMLYLIHFLIDVMIAQPVRYAIYNAFCIKEHDDAYDGDVYRTSPYMNVAVHVLLWTICIPIVMMLAHFLEVFVDRPCTAFGKWVDDKLINGITLREKVFEEEEQLLQAPATGQHELHNLPQR